MGNSARHPFAGYDRLIQTIQALQIKFDCKHNLAKFYRILLCDEDKWFGLLRNFEAFLVLG